MIIKAIQEKETVYPQCPTPYQGIGRICDIVEASKKNDTDPDRIRFICEIDEWIDDTYRFTVASKPLYPSIAKDSEMRKFIETVLGRPLNSIESKKGYDIETLIGSFVHVTVDKVTVKGKDYVNITQLETMSDSEPGEWDSEYIRIQDR